MTVVPRLVIVALGEETLRESVCRAIGVEGHRAIPVSAGSSPIETSARGEAPALAIVEVGTADLDATEWCRRFRDRSPSAALVLVVSGEEALDAAMSGALRADDWLAKPFSLKELLLRVRLLVRRAGLAPGVTSAWEDRPLMLGPLTVDPLRLSAHWNGQDAGLTVTEFLLLDALVRKAGVVRTREQLVQETFPDHGAGSDRMIEAHVRRIQQRFVGLDARFDALEGVHGAGYRYRTGR